MSNNILSQIFNQIAAGEFISGEEIGQVLGVSRSAVSQNIKKLQSMGLDIYRVTGKGYKLAQSIKLLDSEKLLQNDGIENCNVLFAVDSTNTFLLNKIKSGCIQEGEVAVAECQLAGKGRRGRQWQSPIGSHIYFSKYVSLEDGLSAASALSLAVGVAVAKTCQRFSNERVQLKWPNDVLVNGEKLAGVLVEAEGQSDGRCHLVVGIGINVSMPDLTASAIEQAWTDLYKLNGNQPVDRNQVIKLLNEELEKVIAIYKSERLSNLYNDWNQLNAFKNLPIELRSTSTVNKGNCIGIDDTGALLYNDIESNKVKKVFGGEISLRRAT